MKSKSELASDRASFGAALAALRESKGFMTRYAFSQVVALNQAQVGLVERGGGYTVDSLAAYLDGLGLSLADLLGGAAKGKPRKAAPSEPSEKRPVGRPPKEKVVQRIPALSWTRYEEGAFPGLSGQRVVWAGMEGRGPFLLAVEPAANWTVWHVIYLADWSWAIINHAPYPYIFGGPCGSEEVAKAKIDEQRRKQGLYDGWDFSGEDAAAAEVV